MFLLYFWLSSIAVAEESEEALVAEELSSESPTGMEPDANTASSGSSAGQLPSSLEAGQRSCQRMQSSNLPSICRAADPVASSRSIKVIPERISRAGERIEGEQTAMIPNRV